MTEEKLGNFEGSTRIVVLTELKDSSLIPSSKQWIFMSSLISWTPNSRRAFSQLCCSMWAVQYLLKL